MKGVIWELRMLVRYQIVMLYVVLTVIYGFLLSFLDVSTRVWLYPLLLFTDTSVIGIFFTGGLFYFERTEGTLLYRLQTPVSATQSLFDRSAAFGIVSTISGTGIALIGGVACRWYLVLPVLFIGAYGFTLVGSYFALKNRTIAAYFFSTLGFALVLFSPVFPAVGWVPDTWFRFLPTHWLLVLFEAAVADALPGTTSVVFGLAYVVMAILVLQPWVAGKYPPLVVRGEVKDR